MPVSLNADQATALCELLKLEGAIALDVASETHMSLRVSVYFASGSDDEDAPPVAARWFTVSVAGTVREIAATPEAA